ncbi:hypothetical protein GCM10010277_81900 [Streptomyces longisporoflavus]|nr:hypothetical protein GCM10010277_81900 [Streptomyces longisporoflavus]
MRSLAPAEVALVHHVTVVRLARRLLEAAEFTCRLMTKPAPSWLRAWGPTAPGRATPGHRASVAAHRVKISAYRAGSD